MRLELRMGDLRRAGNPWRQGRQGNGRGVWVEREFNRGGCYDGIGDLTLVTKRAAQDERHFVFLILKGRYSIL